VDNRALWEPTAPKRRLVLLCLLVTGAVLRLWGVGAKSLWVDEINAVMMSETFEQLMRNSIAGHEPPVRLMIVWLLQKGPPVDLLVRLPAAIFGTLTIVLMLRIGRRLWDWPTGLAAAGLLLLSPWHVLHSQDARYYAMILFLALAALELALRIVERPRPLAPWLALGIVCALNLYISYVASLAILPLAAWLLWHMAKAWRRPDEEAQLRWYLRGGALATAVILVAFLPWLQVLARVARQYTGLEAPVVARPQRLVWETPYNWPYWMSYVATLGVQHWLVKWALAAFVAIGLVRSWFHARSIFLLAIFWFVLPWAIILTTGVRYFTPPRYLIHYLGLYLLLAGAGAVWTWDLLAGRVRAIGGAFARRAARTLLYGAAGLLGAVVFLAFAREVILYHRIGKQDWKGVVRYLDRHVDPTREVVLAGGSWTERGLRYYWRDMQQPPLLIERRVHPSEILYELQVRPNVWYVTWGPMLPETAQLLAQRFELVERFPGFEGEVWVLRTRREGTGNG